MTQSLPINSPQMTANIQAILSQTPEDPYIHDGVTASVRITDPPKTTAYYIEVVFHNTLKAGMTYTDPVTKEQKDMFEFTPFKINHIKLEQDFTSNYMNHYELNVQLTVQQYMLLYYNYKDLKCNIKLYCADITTGLVIGIDQEGEPVLEIQNAHCIFKDKQDILKRIPKNSIIPESEEKAITPNHEELIPEDILFQIIPHEDHEFRSINANTILNQSTMTDALWALAWIGHETGSVEVIMLVDPDNTIEYRNLIIPPVMSVPEAVNFLQEHYGVYNKGISCFYEFGILYIFPRYEMLPPLPKDKSEAWGSGYKYTQFTSVNGPLMMDEVGDGGMTHIYAAGNNAYSGQQYYHGYEQNTIHIVSNGMSVFKDLTDEGIENVAYGYLVAHGDRIIDKWRTVVEAESQKGARYGIYPIDIMQSPNIDYLVQDKQNEQIGITSTHANIEFIPDMGNPFAVQSRLNSYRRILTTFEWNMAVPLTFRPGYKICYHYDYEDETARDLGKPTGESLKYSTKYGVVESVTYMLEISRHADTRYLHTCKATVLASLEADITQHTDSV